MAGSRALRRRAARRRIRPGFPIEPRPFSRAEIIEYMSGDRITCLLCGKDYRKIGIHLLKCHGITPDDYRARYGLPWSKGLCCQETRARHSALAKKNIEEGRIPLQYGVPVPRGTQRPSQPFMTEVAQQNGLKANGLPRTWGDADAEAILAEMAKGRPLKHVLGDPGRPGSSWFHDYCRSHPEFVLRIDEAWDALPFPVAAAGGRLGPRFVAELRKLFDNGMSDQAAAAVLGVTAMACNRHSKPWRTPKPTQ